jgi:aminoglycoside phosphotransferase family enzyme/predicted kinase
MIGLPPRLRGLLDPRSYPHPVRSVELVQTHISWVLLTGEWAYKIMRPVRYAFIDLRARPRRTFLCREALRLNRRFAPDLYVAVCPITAARGQARIGGAGTTLEFALKMRQFRREDELDHLLESQRILPQELERFGRDLARIHQQLPVASPGDESGQPAAVLTTVLENLTQCAHAAAVFDAGAAVEALRIPFQTRLKALTPWIAARRRDGRVRECHGDLHCGNIVRRGGTLIAFDCLEFEPAFRWIDVADEIALLLADLQARQRAQHAAAFLAGYLTQGGDFQACRVLSLYQAHRALVRAKVMALQGGEGARGGFAHHLEAARGFLGSTRPILILMSGLSGSGKTWIAERLAPLLGAIHLRSDVERKRLAGVDERGRSGSGLQEGLYSSESSVHVYHHLQDCAADTLAGGYPTILDATFIRRADRARFHAFAAQRGIKVCLVWCEAPPEVLRARIQERLQKGQDPSEAGSAVLAWQQNHAEPVTADESFRIFQATSSANEVDRLGEEIARWGELTHTGRPA